MVNKELLGKKLEASGYRIGFVCDSLGISHTAFGKKVNSKTPFRVAEIYVLCDLLHINADEKMSIFFADKVE